MEHDSSPHEGTGATRAAIEHARSALGLGPGEPAQAWPVTRTQPGARNYVLVVFGARERASAIAAVDAESNEVLESARLPGREAHTLVGAGDAIARAGSADDAKARLVWDPSSATRSRFYPLWEIEDAARTVWVDSVTGRVWLTLVDARGGG